ncbi:hypothetical protein NKR23_g12016 [Pleurostoma richardsiae]|uniref:Cyanovirin-N domain-containing protein n=1 Tax=Pleurostoma richardsiae TaxID=41990 RepID=A0AA38RHM0_9PEZI|nr:hypothetical protein NKR23_g12016 [Pleurostoma richardsiae]
MIPDESFRNSCTEITLDQVTMVLSANCRTVTGEIRRSKLDLSKSIRCTKVASKEGLALIDGSEDRLVRLTQEAQNGYIENVHLGDEKYFRAWVKYQVTMMDNFFKGFTDNNWYWKWAQVDLDQCVRNNNGNLEIVTKLPSSLPDWITEVVSEDQLRSLVIKGGLSLLSKGTSPGDASVASAVWGTSDRLAELRAEQEEREKAWYDGTYVQKWNNKLVRRGT